MGVPSTLQVVVTCIAVPLMVMQYDLRAVDFADATIAVPAASHVARVYHGTGLVTRSRPLRAT